MTTESPTITRALVTTRMSVYFAVGVVLAFAVNPVSTLCECGYRSLIDTKARPLNATERDLVLDGDSPNLLADRLVGYLDLENVNTNTDTQAVSRIVATPFVWTDLLETDFLHLDEISKDTDWSLQNYSVSAQADRGPFGMRFLLEDVELNRIPDLTNWTGPGENGGDPGLQLSVQAGVSQDGFTSCAQMNSVRDDMLWGSYRALLKLPLVSGTCSAFFWYFNDSQEIDMEILSSQFYKNNNTFLINLVHQSPQSASQGFSVIGKDYEVADLPFDPTSGFHEYRIDYLPDQIIFYGDGQVIGFMNSTVSPQPGHLILTHWSNGDKGCGPINLSNLTANGSLSLAIGPGFFFMQPNMTGNQTVYQSTAVGYHKERTTWRNTRVCLFSVAVLIGTLF
ncbi:hypothetical protein QTJ16_003318 [Diplocarpon rosae]|uniref:GH16 domain-containing protein n=1 Tax=Diplocarpon rosae TaxID=946125 RepID=A0AAD9T2B6_9HELO|nr:hypothetical protein QTJ16_003318 [Diplocarpon rosae]